MNKDLSIHIWGHWGGGGVCVGGGGVCNTTAELMRCSWCISYSWEFVIVWMWCWQSMTRGKQYLYYSQFTEWKRCLIACQQNVRPFVSEHTWFFTSILSAADNLEKNPVVNPSGKNLSSFIETQSRIWFYQISTYRWYNCVCNSVLGQRN